jgi:23S rRNA pseudouridine1911/1915/1917 synthase
MREEDTIIVEEAEEGKRLDKLLSDRFPDSSRTYFQSLIERELVLLNGSVVKKRILPQAGDEIEIEFALTPEISLEPENIPLDILYEDEDLLAINKPSGMVVHPGAGNFSHTFVNALLYYCKELKGGESLRPGIVHRLDKETTGVLLAAKREEVHQKLVAQFARREVSKEYVAVCVGNPGSRIVEGQIGRHPVRRKEMTLLETGGRASKTEIKTLYFDGILSFVRLFPETGRTHQLRVHLKSLGTPILGDSVYGSASQNKKFGVTRQLLHAYKLNFTHPITKKRMEMEAPIPQDIAYFLEKLKRV